MTSPRLIALASLAFVSVAFAHSDMEKSLFVAAGGADRGRCLDPAEPCRTLAYALDRVGKGGQIRVAAGAYRVDDVEDLFHIVSGIVTVRGGYDPADGFQTPAGRTTTLTGVPVEYRSLLASRGFHVVADRKPQPEVAAQTRAMLDQRGRMQAGLKPAPCAGGQSDGLACENAELLAHVSFAEVSAQPTAAADVWGFVDLNTLREYAIVSYNTGTAVFDVSDPEAPREVGFVDGQNTTWRDVKVYQYFDAAAGRWQAYAYVTTDGSTDGLFVIDLTGLPQRITRVNYASDFSAAHNLFAATTDYATGLSLTGQPPALVIAGSSNGGGRFRTYSLDDPAAPAFLALPNVSGNDYMHDAASMLIRDARKDTQCVNAGAYCEVLFDFNESTVDIYDITDPTAPVRLSRAPYSGAAYTHSGWPSEDGQYLFVHDELDEQQFGQRTTLRTFSLADLTAPVETSVWRGPTNAIDHNGFVRGNRYYMSNYSRGLTILDISDPNDPQSVGRLDTYPFSDGTSFVGAWGAYPYLPSGNVAVSDMSSGFYMIGDRTLGSTAGTLAFAARSVAVSEGASISIIVERLNGSSGQVSVNWDVVPGSADSGDIAETGGSLTWADGDAAAKTLTLTAPADGASEGLEQLLLRLSAPTGSATLGVNRLTQVFVADAGAAGSVEFDRAVVDAAERGFGKAIVTVQRRGNATGAASIDYALSNGDATPGSDFTGATTGTVSWAAGDALPKSIEFELVDDGSGEADEFFELTLSNPSGTSLGSVSTVRVNVLDGTGFNQPPNALAGFSQSVSNGAQVTLDASGSNDPDGDTLSYQWTQLLGPQVALSGANTATATFTAPSVQSDTLLQFRVQVSDPGGLTDTATANVTVRGTATGQASSGGGGALGRLALLVLGAMFAAFTVSRRRGAS